jgi:hypothetical protein
MAVANVPANAAPNHAMLAVTRPASWSPREIVSRSLFPLVALLLLALLPLVGPWFLLVATFVWWRIVTRIG